MSSSAATPPIGFQPAADLRHIEGPFDIVGDVHGCADELIELLGRLSWRVRSQPGIDGPHFQLEGPAGRRLLFVGDLVDRGPRSPDALRIVMAAVETGAGLCVPGNHDAKFLRWLHGRNVKPTHGLDVTIEQMNAESDAFRVRVRTFMEGLPLHLWLDGGRLVVVHAGIEERMIGATSPRIREFCLYGDTDGTDEAGLPIRYHWAVRYGGEASVVYGHTPVAEPDWVNNTLCIDTGCCFGGALTALRWPEREIVSVPAIRQYAERRRPFGHPPLRPMESKS